MPRLPLAVTPTPYQAAPRLAAALGLARLHVKREDLSGPALGGNKIRSIELILAAARKAGADTVLTTAASQSNFCRALAGCAVRAGLRCRLLLRSAGGRTILQLSSSQRLLSHVELNAGTNLIRRITCFGDQGRLIGHLVVDAYQSRDGRQVPSQLSITLDGRRSPWLSFRADAAGDHRP